MTAANVVNLPYEIREPNNPEGGVQLELFVEGKRIARASASLDMVDAMERQLGVERQGVVAELRRSLEELLKNQLDKVSVTDTIEDSGRPLKFWARYTYRDGFNIGGFDIETGLVWYDINTSETGPEELPAVVRNKMRLEVHRKLTSQGSNARALVDMHE